MRRCLIRLRAEYLYSIGDFFSIQFHFTSGHLVPYDRWRGGERPMVDSNRVTWRKTAPEDSSYLTFRKYLITIFIYAGTYSLSRELKARLSPQEMQIGDVFIQSGFPGHAVLVVDMVQSETSGEKLFLLLQSYMPAQEMHILKNPNDETISPWYRIPESDELYTPEWTFRLEHLKYFDR